jgi:protein O-GlcNAc transferase
VTAARAMQQAGVYYGSGQWALAEQLCRSILTARPDDFGALSLLGMIAAQTSRTSEAAGLLEHAIRIRPEHPGAANSYGNVLIDLGDFERALASFDRALRSLPKSAEICFNRGNALRALKRFDEALASYERAIELKADFAEAHNNRGLSLWELKRTSEALACYEQAARLQPSFAEAHYNCGNVLADEGRFDEALASFERALQLKPDHAQAYGNRGKVLLELNRFEEALEGCERAVRINPDKAEAHNSRGVALLRLHRLDEALASFERALQLKPDYAQAYCNRGNALQSLNRFDEALASCERALQLKPDYADAHCNRGNALKQLLRVAEALEDYERALRINGDGAWLYGIWMHLRMQLCEWSAYGAHLAALFERVKQGKRTAAPFVVVTLTDSLALQRRAAQAWGETCRASSSALPPLATRGRRARIRVGYYSADFHDHATAYLAAELFERHDRNRFEVVAFSFGPDASDAMRGRLIAAFDRFVDVRARSEREIALLSRQLEIDIAVDLKGHTGDARTGIFAHRAAPVQVNYLGYPGTMAVPYIDYLIADPVLIPPESRAYYTEKIVYLPDTYQVNDRKRRIAEHRFTREELGLPPAAFVYCCFNNAYKITPDVFAGWMRILGQVPGSVLWLLTDSERAVGNLRKEAEARGVDGARLLFASRCSLPEHLARQRAADLFLDTLPCNAHTTASDALWVGLPVLTRMGESFVARVAASLLKAAGLPELITSTAEHYEALAVGLARDPGKLAAIKEKLQHNRLTAPLFDTALFAQHLELAYGQMYERYLAGLGPDDLWIAAR